MAGGVGVTANGLNIQQIRDAEDGDAQTGVDANDSSAWMTSLSESGFDQDIMDELQALIDDPNVGYDDIADFLEGLDLNGADDSGDGKVGAEDAQLVKDNRIDLDWIKNDSGLDMEAPLDPDKKDEWLGKLKASGMEQGEFDLIQGFFNNGITNGMAVELFEALDAVDDKEDGDLDALDVENLFQVQIQGAVSMAIAEATNDQGETTDDNDTPLVSSLNDLRSIGDGDVTDFATAKANAKAAIAVILEGDNTDVIEGDNTDVLGKINDFIDAGTTDLGVLKTFLGNMAALNTSKGLDANDFYQLIKNPDFTIGAGGAINGEFETLEKDSEYAEWLSGFDSNAQQGDSDDSSAAA